MRLKAVRKFGGIDFGWGAWWKAMDGSGVLFGNNSRANIDFLEEFGDAYIRGLDRYGWEQ